MRIRLSAILVPFLAAALSGAEIAVPAQDGALAEALAVARDGDVLVLADGVHAGGVVVDRQVTLRARTPGRAVITNAAPTPRFVAAPGEPGTWVAEVPWPVCKVMAGDDILYDYRDREALRGFIARARYCRRDADSPFGDEGFAWEDGRLWLRLRGGRDPADAAIAIHRDVRGASTRFLRNNGIRATETWVRPEEWPLRLPYAGGKEKVVEYPRLLGRLIAVRADGVTIEGLRLHLAPHVGIDAQDCADLTVRDCLFTGFQHAVTCWERCTRITIERCEFHGGGIFERFAAPGLRDAIYYTDLEINVVAQRGSGFVFRGNRIQGAFDGIQFRGTDPALLAEVPDLPSEISGNLVMDCIDNNLELDSWMARTRLRVHGNLVLDGRVLLSCAPVQGGPLRIERNLFVQSAERGLGGVVIKTDQPLSGSRPMSGLALVHNTFVMPRSPINAFSGEWVDCIVDGNLFAISRAERWDRPGFTPTRHNLFHGPKVAAEVVPGAIVADPGFIATDPLDPALAPGSPALGAAADGGDLGAIPHGTRWELPMPGVTWHDDDLARLRTPLPASVRHLVRVEP